MSKRNQWEKLGDAVVLRVSRRGGALYLHLRKDLVEFHRIQAGDRMRVKFVSISREARREEEAQE